MKNKKAPFKVGDKIQLNPKYKSLLEYNGLISDFNQVFIVKKVKCFGDYFGDGRIIFTVYVDGLKLKSGGKEIDGLQAANFIKYKEAEILEVF